MPFESKCVVLSAGLVCVVFLGVFFQNSCAAARRDQLNPEAYWRCVDVHQTMPDDFRLRPREVHQECLDRWDYWGQEKK